MKAPAENFSAKRVYITTPSHDDMEDFLRCVKKSTHFHSPWVQPPTTEREYLDYVERGAKENQAYFFVKLNVSNELVGVMNISEIVRGCFQSAYLGFYAFFGYEGQGLMSEGLMLVISYAFRQLKLHRLEACIQPDNLASLSFAKRHEFQYEGFSREYLKINGQWKDHERFALICGENI